MKRKEGRKEHTEREGKRCEEEFIRGKMHGTCHEVEKEKVRVNYIQTRGKGKVIRGKKKKGGWGEGMKKKMS